MPGDERDEIAVLGLGNVLMGDDALGPYVVAILQANWDFPPEVVVEDLGTPGLDLQPYLARRRAIVLVDTVRAEGEPGSVRVYSQQEILKHSPGQRTSPHDPGVKEALLSLEFAGNEPQAVSLVGVIPSRVEHATELSSEIRAALPQAVQAVIEQLSDLGCKPRKREDPEAPNFWWEREAETAEE